VTNPEKRPDGTGLGCGYPETASDSRHAIQMQNYRFRFVRPVRLGGLGRQDKVAFCMVVVGPVADGPENSRIQAGNVIYRSQ
jgi:hypothetical protein